MSRSAQPKQAAEHIDGRAPGRPRDAAIDELVLRVTIDLLAERGMEATTIQAVSDRSGIARATIYLRWPGRSALILAALRWAIGRPPFELSGDIATDFQRAVERVLGVFSQPMFIAAMPALMGAFLGAEGSAPGVTFDMLFPNRLRLIDAYQRRAEEQGYRTDVDATVVVDALLGGLFMHLITTGQAPTRAVGQELVAILVAATRSDPKE
jgi:AcrR family transcriptional regulator